MGDELETQTQPAKTPDRVERENFWTEWARNKNPEDIGMMLAQKEGEAEHDTLTGIYNKRGFSKKVEEELKKMNGKGYSIIFLDLNYLGQINDLMGHEEGNYWVLETAKAMRSAARKRDIYGRWTQGDEFLMFLPEATREEAETVWKQTEANFNPSFLISGGITENETGSTLEETIRRAEQDMYSVKQVKKGLTPKNG